MIAILDDYPDKCLCGSTPAVVHMFGHYLVRCANCHAFYGSCSSMTAAISKWNYNVEKGKKRIEQNDQYRCT